MHSVGPGRLSHRIVAVKVRRVLLSTLALDVFTIRDRSPCSSIRRPIPFLRSLLVSTASPSFNLQSMSSLSCQLPRITPLELLVSVYTHDLNCTVRVKPPRSTAQSQWRRTSLYWGRWKGARAPRFAANAEWIAQSFAASM